MPSKSVRPEKVVVAKKARSGEVPQTKVNALMIMSYRMHLLAQEEPKKVRVAAG